MWALRRASATSLRAHGLNIAAFRACTGLGPFGSHVEDESTKPEQHTCRLDGCLPSKRCNHAVCVPTRFSIACHSFSSHAGAKSGGEEEDDLEDGFSELETPEESVTALKEEVDNDSSSDSESDLSSDENIEDVLETELLGDREVGSTTTVSKKKSAFTDLFKLILDERGPSICDALDTFIADGKELNRDKIYATLLMLRRRKLFGKALQLSVWVEAKKVIEFQERDYASRVDLIAKLHGLQKAESYIEKIPKSERGEVVYRTLLANCVVAANTRKAEEVFNKMKNLGFPLTTFSCNQLLLLYKRTDKRKMADILLIMEKENLKPTPFTYMVLIDTKGQSNDMVGMDQIVETMKAEGIEPNRRILATLARHYSASGLKEKAEELLKEIEGGDLQANRWVTPILLRIYADVRKPEEVKRVWEACESNTRDGEYIAAIEAFGKLKKIKDAEDVFSKLKTIKKPTSRLFTTMLKVYAENKMISKGKEVLKEMGDNGCPIGPLTWDAIVKLYVDAGEVEKADSILHKAAQRNSLRPLYTSYMYILDHYARRGDVHNAEKTFHRMRQAGYVSRIRPYYGLLQAYIVAKAPAYGIRERLKGDNIIPSKGLSGQLAMVDAFKKTVVSDLLD